MSRALGDKGEVIAARYLQQKGYRVFAKNIRLAGCEIDLIARDGAEVVFVEVKTRQTTGAGYPEDSVTPRKVQHMERAAHAWLLQEGEQPWRLDVVAVTLGGAEPEVQHFTGI